MSALINILEKIPNRRLTWHLEANNLLNPFQYGGRKNRSSTKALAELDALIHKANTNGSDLYSIFFDLENAFPAFGDITFLPLSINTDSEACSRVY